MSVHLFLKKIINKKFNVLFLLAFLVLTAVIVQKAFIVEDAYINFSHIRNFNDGFYLSAIPDVRSQSATSNLWLLILLAGSYILDDLPNLAICLSFIFTAAAILLMMNYFSKGKKKWLALAFPLLLSLSTSFTDYSTSGLENSLAHMLGALFLLSFVKKREEIDFLLLTFYASLLIMVRYDFCVLIVIGMVWIFFNRKQYLSDIKMGLIGFLPLWIWLAFSWFYYGSVFPDTYYAKMASTGIDFLFGFNSAILHHLRLLDFDPVGAYVMIVAMGLTVALSIQYFFKKTYSVKEMDKRAKLIAIGLGIILYNAYFFYAGGDYMIGRLVSIDIFFSVFFLFLFIKSFTLSNKTQIFFLSALVIVCSVKITGLSIFVPQKKPDGIFVAGTLDMRKFQQNWFFIAQNHDNKDWKLMGLKQALEADKVLAEYPRIHENGSGGIIPYYAGPKNRLVDYYGLLDPLLSKLPCQQVSSSAGHCGRKTPKGYIYFIKTGDKKEMDIALGQYTEILYKIKTLPLFSWERICILIDFSMGKYDKLISDYTKRHAKEYMHSNWKKMKKNYQDTCFKSFFASPKHR